MMSKIKKIIFEEKWKGLGSIYAFTYACLVAYLEAMYGKQDVDKFLDFMADQAKPLYAPLKGKSVEEASDMLFSAGQSFFDILDSKTASDRHSIVTSCLMRNLLKEMHLRSDLICTFCEQVLRPAIYAASDYEMQIDRTAGECKISLSRS
ncbi:MAG: hypothetical protein EAX81_03715 [Candidatus Thorarchaeota archaeon]|nr:hypothetical protein [Candidatus Thorarchaeota archaeon]